MIRETIQRKRVTILLFHQIDPTNADIYFKTLSKKYNIISLNNYLECLQNNEFEKLPIKSMIITFDDGFNSNYLLKPVFKKYNINATIFLCAGIVGTKRHFWFAQGLNSDVKQRLKQLPNTERLNYLKECGITDDKEFDYVQALSREEIEDLKEIVDFQSHTIYHPILKNCTDEEAEKEIILSKKILEEQYGLEIFGLAYPNGDYKERDILFVQKAGYKYGVTLDRGYNNSKTDIFKLKRFVIRDNCDVEELLVKASGLWKYIVDLLKINTI